MNSYLFQTKKMFLIYSDPFISKKSAFSYLQPLPQGQIYLLQSLSSYDSINSQKKYIIKWQLKCFTTFQGRKIFCICYGGKRQDILSFVSPNNISFADNLFNQNSSQEYAIKLFDSTIVQRANKQDTVTTSSTKEKLSAVSQIAKKEMYFSQIIKSPIFILSKVLTIEYNNQQTIWLFVKKAMKL